ncbi:hypothetical protein GCM10009720_16210 [Yaniella flava]|uniref:Uncharacterized protein n=1 Tax=Yaniella flava TaxID=287930 RepID=A0ABN2UHV2_9MICC
MVSSEDIIANLKELHRPVTVGLRATLTYCSHCHPMTLAWPCDTWLVLHGSKPRW